jgi:tetratricopeptide (TPR) repeat protein
MSFARHSAVAVLITLVLLASCGTTRIQVPVLRPAEINTGGFKRAVTTGFKNTTALSNEGDQLEFALSRRLVETGCFNVMDKLLFDKLTRGEVTAQNDLLVISGVVNEYAYNEAQSESKPYERDGKRFVDYRRDGVLRFGVTFQVSRASDAKILGVKTIGRELTATTRATNGPPAPIAVPAMVNDAREQVIAAFLKKIMPYEELASMDFYSEKTIPELDIGIDCAKRGDWDCAISTFGRATETHARDQQVHVAWYNLALAYQCVGRFGDAEQAFVRALQFDPANNDYRRALDQCRQTQADYLRVQAQGN